MNWEKFIPAVTIAVCLAATFFFMELFYTPMQRDILSAQMESRKLHAVEKNLSNFVKRHGDLGKFSAQIETRLYEVQELLPAEPAQDAFVIELYRNAEKNKVLINSIQIGELQIADENSADNNVARQTIRLSVEADYISTLNFLRDILNGNRLTALENISLDGGKNILTGDLELTIFSTSL